MVCLPGFTEEGATGSAATRSISVSFLFLFLFLVLFLLLFLIFVRERSNPSTVTLRGGHAG
jgi:hypothetical protein